MFLFASLLLVFFLEKDGLNTEQMIAYCLAEIMLTLSQRKLATVLCQEIISEMPPQRESFQAV